MRSVAVSAAILALAAAPIHLAADSATDFPFRLEPLKELAIGGAGLALYGSSFYFESIKAKPDPSAVNAAAIPFFDRLYTTTTSAWMETGATVLLVAAAAIPAAILPGLDSGEIFTVGAMYAETLGMAFAIDASLKSIVTRYRPYAYAASGVDFTSSDITASFPSSHSTLIFASAVFAGYVFDQVQPGSPWSPLVWGSGLALATATSVLLVASGDHFPSDVVAGAVFGALCGYLVPALHKTKAAPGSPGVALSPLPDGLLLALRL
jgi:membrane-associated phospholipid phosphatase